MEIQHIVTLSLLAIGGIIVIHPTEIIGYYFYPPILNTKFHENMTDHSVVIFGYGLLLFASSITVFSGASGGGKRFGH